MISIILYVGSLMPKILKKKWESLNIADKNVNYDRPARLNQTQIFVIE